MGAGTGALGSAPRRPLASVARTDYSLRCGAKPRSPCPIATVAFNENFFFGPMRGHRQKWCFFMFARVEKKSLNPVDKHGLTFQQVQKYEKGTNRIGAGRLHQISHILQVPVAFFFEGAPNLHGSTDRMKEAPSPSYVSDFLATPEGLSRQGPNFFLAKNCQGPSPRF